jgi:outer membrane protein assembly factor BamB
MMKYTKWIIVAILGCGVSQVALANLKPAWDATYRTLALYEPDFPIKLSPSISSDLIYVADPNGTVNARDAQTGKTVWEKKMHYKFTAGPYYHDNKLYLGSQEGKLIALDANEKGKVLWKTALASEILASPKANNEFIFVNTMDGKFYALDAESGRIVWSFDRAVPQLILRQGSAPVIQDNVVLSGFASGKILAFDLQTGALIWEKMVATPKGHSELDRMVDISADLLTDGQTVFSSAFQGQTVGLNIQTGMTVWERDIDTQHNMALDNDVLYLTDNKNVLWALDAKTGATLWKQTHMQHYTLTGPAIYQDKLIVGSLNGRVMVFDKNDGKLLEKKQFKSHHFTQSPVISQDMAYLMSKEGKLTAIEMQF